jgi:two-component system OmpR family sensor kinase
VIAEHKGLFGRFTIDAIGMGDRVNYSGLVVAGIGFFLTRFTVTLALYQDPVRFYLAGVVPLMLGLGLAAFGIALAVADVKPSLVRTVTVWCVVGTAAMGVLVVLTLLGSTTGGLPEWGAVRSRAYLSNFLIGGSVGGTLTGLYAARNRRQRGALRRQTYRLEVLNRLLRHEVLNAVNVIRGHAGIDRGRRPEAAEIIRDRSETIERTIDEVKYLTKTAGTGTTSVASVDLGASLAASVETVREQHPAADISMATPDTEISVRANERLEQVFSHLLENAVVHAPGDDVAVEVGVETTATGVRVSVADGGPGLPERQQHLLKTGEIGEFDDPGSGFGLNVVRLLVESYGGAIETAVDDGGTTVTVVLPRADPVETVFETADSGIAGVRPAVPHLLVTLGASIVAGVLYGAVSILLGGSVAAIGVFYGQPDPVVGWITHEFHSAVFAFVFSGLVSLSPARYRDSVPAYLLVGLAWGFVLWVLAAGVVAPVWLRLLGTAVPVPSLSPDLLAPHLVWGLSLGALVAVGYQHVTPRLAGVLGRLRR